MGKVDLEGRPASQLAEDIDVAPALADDAVDDRQPQARSFPGSLVVKNGSKMRRFVVSSMPAPVSVTATRA